jgi:threonyl-tRNA synthetase
MINEHRKIGRELELFELSDHSQGMINWYPLGYEIYLKIENYIREIQSKYNYQEVKSPILANQKLWEQSGHNEKYKDNMFFLNDNQLAIKPMSCPFHINMFQSLCKSYRELPLRLAEFGLCHRNEASGSLNGLFRLRSFNQDDGHVFCREDQIKEELKSFSEMLFEIYKHFGFEKKDINVKISLRPKNRIGSDELWERSENYLKEGLNDIGIKYELIPDEGAFYGAKVEFSLKDSMKREWQCGTFQLDFFLAEKFDASYINENNEKEHPVILHRAALGSLERFIAILIEHYNGKLPSWLNPNAIVLIPVENQKHLNYSISLRNKIREKGISCNIDSSDNSVGYKVRGSFKNKAINSIVIGDQELESDMLNVRQKKNVEIFKLEDFINSL